VNSGYSGGSPAGRRIIPHCRPWDWMNDEDLQKNASGMLAPG
jgi:hypothetical protein